MRSTSADRCAISWLEVIPCARIASLNCAPIDLTGLSAFIALCMTTDRFFHLIAIRSASVSRTMLRPLKITLPPMISAGGDNSCAIANSKVDLPQPDSPTTATNSPGSSAKLTCSTATTGPLSSRYSTERSFTSRMAPGCAGTSTASRDSAARLDTGPPQPERAGAGPLHPPGTGQPQRAQLRVADLVERVIEQRESGTQGHDAQARRDDPQCLPGLERLGVLGRVQHRPPADLGGVTEAEELQADREQHGTKRVAQETGHDQRRHGRDDLDDNDVERPLAPYPGRLEEVPVAQRQRLRAQLPGGIRPAGEGQHRDHDQRAGAVQVTRDDDEQREQRDDQQHVGDDVQHSVPEAAQVGGSDSDQHRDAGRGDAYAECDKQHGPGAVDDLREHVLAEAGRAEQVAR